ncbi:MAG TPA: ArsC family reductase [Burkholderiaceae bacterium]|nr:ArsC family reductase [Burkholderiaceae bacterium]
MTIAPILYGITQCDTVKRACTWFDERGAGYRFHDYKKAGVPQDHLDRWLQSLGWERLVNRQGTTWRKLDDASKAAIADSSSARELMLRQPSVIKRPVIEWPDGSVSVGFDAGEYARRLA